MAGLVNQNLTTSFEQSFPILPYPPLPIESWVVTGKAEYSHAIPQRGLAENEIPCRIRIEVLHGDG